LLCGVADCVGGKCDVIPVINKIKMRAMQVSLCSNDNNDNNYCNGNPAKIDSEIIPGKKRMI